ncbi:MAG TPA: 50S ribosomal protein L31 [Candidatus Nitrosocosmicus sp.]|nr:50S ribosomal protein L31 [Candidatus Nitrosocosmicus sp.]
MKASIHPSYHKEVEVVCTCGNTFTTGSTKEKINTEVCFKCHPLYTGEKRFMDARGQIGKFQERQKIASQQVQTKKKKQEKDVQRPQSLRELLGNM